MSEQLPTRRNLDSLKKEAKRWLAALQANVEDARARLERALDSIPGTPTLRDACHKLTNEGIASLARLPCLRELRVSGRRLTRDVDAPFPPGVTVHYSP